MQKKCLFIFLLIISASILTANAENKHYDSSPGDAKIKRQIAKRSDFELTAYDIPQNYNFMEIHNDNKSKQMGFIKNPGYLDMEKEIERMKLPSKHPLAQLRKSYIARLESDEYLLTYMVLECKTNIAAIQLSKLGLLSSSPERQEEISLSYVHNRFFINILSENKHGTDIEMKGKVKKSARRILDVVKKRFGGI